MAIGEVEATNVSYLISFYIDGAIALRTRIFQDVFGCGFAILGGVRDPRRFMTVMIDRDARVGDDQGVGRL